MNEIKINEIALKFNDAEKFQRIKEHMELCGEKELNNEFVAMQLIEIGMNVYKFI